MRASAERGIDDAVRVRLQRAADAGAALARRLVAGGTIGFSPFDGGSEELSVVLAGRSNLASRFSSSAMRASAACNCPTSGSSDRMSPSFSATVSLLRSISGGTQSLNQVARDRVNHFRDHQRRRQTRTSGATRVSNYTTAYFRLRTTISPSDAQQLRTYDFRRLRACATLMEYMRAVVLKLLEVIAHLGRQPGLLATGWAGGGDVFCMGEIDGFWTAGLIGRTGLRIALARTREIDFGPYRAG